MSDDPPNWTILFNRQPKKILRHLPKPIRERLRKEIDVLASNQHPVNSKKLTGFDELYRLRVGDWRIIYTIEDDQLIVLVIRIAPRGDAYKGL